LFWSSAAGLINDNETTLEKRDYYNNNVIHTLQVKVTKKRMEIIGTDWTYRLRRRR